MAAATSPVAAAVDPFAVPAGPRDDAAADTDGAPLDLGPWKKARTAKGVPPPAPTCATKDKAKDKDARSVAARADAAPVECADAIADAYLDALAAAPAESPSAVRLVIGLSLAGKLARTANAPPAMGAIKDKEKVKAFVSGPLKTWLVEQSTAIEVLSSGAAGLSGRARGVAAIEAGIAEMRLVDKMRSAPVPATWDAELKGIYASSLDEALEPRKQRGRDAALVGMSDFAKLGVLRDARLDRARALLSKLYGGRRIDALDGLLLSGEPGKPKDARWRLDMGRVYWRRVDFVEAAHAAKASAQPEDRLVLAVALALTHGPNGAAEMMRASSPALLDLKHTEALDALVAEGGPLAGLAAYDAAHLRALSPPDGDAAGPYLHDVAARFRKAESLLSDPAQKKLAAQRAGDIDAITKQSQ